MAIVERTSKDGKRVYLYEQTSYRDPKTGKVKSPTKYIGPKYPKRKRGGVLSQFLKGGVHLSALAVIGQLPPPGGRHYKDRYRAPDERSEPNPKIVALHARWEREDAERMRENREYGSPNSPQMREVDKLVKEIVERFRSTLKDNSNSDKGEDDKHADSSEADSGKDVVASEVEVGDSEGDGEPL